ncbi:hypothetical protein [Streptomyces triticirhizae]|uniref:Uncharacterized protein n=1 Tax=Streptomyces triticirhizae TaxID=2483353 RepID=A0A3M2MB58_9ACTN|nr:hypothetical protein [Streptomyces triticirhizae]RMI46749.1 hypothetical protein EBN88_00520 [Streptomyces triticirhizae]
MEEDQPTRRMTIIVDTPTFTRRVDHDHFAPGEQVLIILGAKDGALTGDVFDVVAPSWHQATDVDGWRVRDPRGGTVSYFTAAPKYLIHTGVDCSPCVDYLRQLERWVLPHLTGEPGQRDTNSYRIVDGELVHIADAITADEAW